MKFNYKRPRSLGARGCWSATQESLRSTALDNALMHHLRRVVFQFAYVTTVRKFDEVDHILTCWDQQFLELIQNICLPKPLQSAFYLTSIVPWMLGILALWQQLSFWF